MVVLRSFLWFCTFVFSLVIVILSAALFFSSSFLFDYVTKNNFVLTPESEIFKQWRKPSVELYSDYYLFNWTNPEDIHDLTVKPRFEEVGPYRYREVREKKRIRWNDNGTITFRQLNTWFFENKTGHGNPDDVVSIINMVTLSAAHLVKNWGYFARKGLSIVLPRQLHVTQSVRKILFEGYEENLLSLAETFPFMSTVDFSGWDKFGLLYTRNGSETFDGIFNMGTGVGGSGLGQLHSWQYVNKTPFFEGTCGEVQGSNGEFFKHDQRETISLFSPNLCRSIIFEYEKEVEIASIKGRKFVIGKKMLDNGTLDARNSCNCGGECAPSGIFNVSSCRQGSPTYISLPHFYDADPYYHRQVDGLKPNKSLHEFYIILDPVTGIPLEVNAKFQVNVLLQPIDSVNLYQEVPRIFVPIMWVEEKFTISEDEAFRLRILINFTLICTWISCVLFGLGTVATIFCFWKIMKSRKNDKEEQFKEQEVPLQYWKR